LVHVIIL